MHRLGLSFEFFNAVDGKNISKNELEKVNFKSALELCGHDLSLGEVGCAMSHINLYEKIISEKIERCIILEDDIYIHSKFREIIEKIILIDNSEITFLYHGKAKSWFIKRNLPDGYRLAKYISPSKKSKRGIISTAGYILSLSGAKKLLSVSYPIRMPADYLTGKLQLNKLKASGVEPSCLDVDHFTTTIDDRNYGEHIKNT